VSFELHRERAIVGAARLVVLILSEEPSHRADMRCILNTLLNFATLALRRPQAADSEIAARWYALK
jgi:hypothetical protein